MTIQTAMEALSELSEKINDYEFDPAKRTYYGIAIDTAVKELANYERLLENKLNELEVERNGLLQEMQQKYVEMQQKYVEINRPQILGGKNETI